MLANVHQRGWMAAAVMTGAVVVLASCQSMSPMMAGQQITLSGASKCRR